MHRATFILAMLLIPSACGFASADAAVPSANYSWKNVKVGAGGFIPGIVFSRVEKDLSYLRSDMGGAYRWDVEAQRWIPMHDQIGESSYFGTESVAPDPVDPNVVYLAAGMYRSDPAAVLRSRDKGKTWEIFPVSMACSAARITGRRGTRSRVFR
jgi:xyloglucan-specific exo-beta-1,4-glucanase